MFGVNRYIEREYQKKYNKSLFTVFVVAMLCVILF